MKRDIGLLNIFSLFFCLVLFVPNAQASNKQEILNYLSELNVEMAATRKIIEEAQANFQLLSEKFQKILKAVEKIGEDGLSGTLELNLEQSFKIPLDEFQKAWGNGVKYRRIVAFLQQNNVIRNEEDLVDAAVIYEILMRYTKEWDGYSTFRFKTSSFQIKPFGNKNLESLLTILLGGQYFTSEQKESLIQKYTELNVLNSYSPPGTSSTQVPLNVIQKALGQGIKYHIFNRFFKENNLIDLEHDSVSADVLYEMLMRFHKKSGYSVFPVGQKEMSLRMFGSKSVKSLLEALLSNSFFTSEQQSSIIAKYQDLRILGEGF